MYVYSLSGSTPKSPKNKFEVRLKKKFYQYNLNSHYICVFLKKKIVFQKGQVHVFHFMLHQKNKTFKKNFNGKSYFWHQFNTNNLGKVVFGNFFDLVNPVFFLSFSYLKIYCTSSLIWLRHLYYTCRGVKV